MRYLNLLFVWLMLTLSNSAVVFLATPITDASAATPAPIAFNLQSPSNRSSSESTTPTFSWGSSSFGVTYTLEVATDAGFGAADVVNQAGLTTPSFTLSTPLNPGVVYFWRVTATNAGGVLVAGNGPFEFSAPIVAGSGFAGSLAVTPDGARVLIANSASSGSVADISLAGHRVINTIPAGAYPAGVAIRGDGLEAVVANSLGHSISVLNLTNDTVKATIPVPCVGTTLSDVAYTPDGARIVLPDLSSGCTLTGLRVITVATQAQNFVNLSNAFGQGVAVMPNGDSALVTIGVLGTSIRRVNLTTLGVTTIANTSSSFGVAVTPDSSQAIVTSGQGDTVKRINLSTNTVVGTVPFGSNQSYHNVAITPDGTQAIVVGDFTTALISLKTDTIVTQYPDGGSGVAISPDGRFAYISAYASGNVVLLKVIRIPAVTPQTGWWWNPAESGRGFTIEVRGNNMFMAGYLYDASGRATWVVSVGPMISSSSYSGALLEFGGGQTLTGAYRPNSALPSPGTISLNFTSATAGTLTWPGGTIPIQRFDIVTGGAALTPPAGTPEAGWWWNAAESGRGFALEIQNGTMFLAGYMYDASGNPIWYASGPTAMTNATTYIGTWNQYGNGQTLTGTYRSATVVNSNVGQITMQFSDTQNGLLTLPDGRQITITRFRF